MFRKIMMAFDKLFCPIRSNKSSKRSSSAASHHQANRQTTENLQLQQLQQQQQQQQQSDVSTNHRNTSGIGGGGSHHTATTTTTNPINQYTANIPYRYVRTEFHAIGQDELTVYPNDLVIYEFSDIEDGKNWAHVLHLAKNERGFVPSEILSTEPPRFSQCTKKKMPRSMADASIDHPHNGGIPHGDSIKLQQPHHHHHHHHHHRHRVDMPPRSLQGSSGCQTSTFQKSTYFSSLSPPSYYNLRSNVEALQYDRYGLDCRPFPMSNLGLYVVMHNFVAREENDLNVSPGEVVSVLNKEDEDWYWVQRSDSGEGFVPSRFICPYEQVQSVLDKGNSTVTMKSSNQIESHTYMNHLPDRESLHTDQQSMVYPNID